MLPGDDTTREIWGFDRAEASDEGRLGPSYLLGLYQRLVKNEGVDPEKLDQWRRQGILLAQTKKLFEAIPAEYRGAHYAWLLKNEYVLDRSQSLPSPSPEELVLKLIWRGWNYATDGLPASEETMRNTIAAWPPRRQECVILCGLLSGSYPPPPKFPLWFQFGFCVGDHHSEMEMVEMYRGLLYSISSFDELCLAYEDARLVELLDRKGLTQSAAYRRVANEFEDVVSGSAVGILKSAWYLKAFIRSHPDPLRSGEELRINSSVFLDYGWMNCEDNHAINRLLRVYQQYFNSPDANCLELHSACVDGRTC
ncbi:hypothetical protein BKA70DRAFT_1427481 [Coprinopsis sp. MPI-PUGE-AT-0042]|nr:hypothetical protein BKA70DRAFT_1427481 [Coprinopsis sp. MPI-PUGE-AT-0042]